MAGVSHESHGTPLDDYQLTKEDHRNQRGAETARDHVAKLIAQWYAEEAADPVLKARRDENRRSALQMIADFQPEDHDLMRWRVRLHCGHITETRRHITITEPRMHGSSSERCTECGLDPSHIVAYEPLGTVRERPTVVARSTPAARRPTRAQLELQVTELEAEITRLRTPLGGPEPNEPA